MRQVFPSHEAVRGFLKGQRGKDTWKGKREAVRLWFAPEALFFVRGKLYEEWRKSKGKARAKRTQKEGIFFFSYTSFLFSFLCFSLLHLGDFLPFSWVSRVKIFPVLSCFPFLFHWWICEGKSAALLALSPAVFQYDSLLFLTFQWLITNKKQNGFPKLSWTNMKRKWNFSVILTWRSKQTFKWTDFYRFFWRSSRTWIEKLGGLKTAKQRQTKGRMNRNQ